MSKLYIFGIGGTGSRVLKSLTMLLAAGVECSVDTIVPIIIDRDKGNGDYSKTDGLIKKYIAVNKIAPKNDNKKKIKNRFFNTEIKLLGNEILLKLDDETKKFEDFIGITTQTKENKSLSQMLFSENTLSMDTEHGFKGNPNIGSVILNQFDNKNIFKAFASDFQDGDKIFIISSIFGGTGASGFPLLRKMLQTPNLKDAFGAELQSWGLINTAPIGAISVLPYFNVDKKDNVDSDTFNDKTRAALSYYETENGKLDTLYYIADTHRKAYKYAEGGKDQENDAHFVEVAAAMSILDFVNADNKIVNFQKDNEGKRKTIYKEFGINSNVKEISFNNLAAETQKLLVNPLSRFMLFAKYMGYKIEKKTVNGKDKFVAERVPKYDIFDNEKKYQPYAKDRFVDDFRTKITDLETVQRMFFDWLQEMDQQNRRFSPFNLTTGDAFNFVNGDITLFTKKKSIYKNWAKVDNELNRQIKETNSSLKEEGKFIELFYRATEAIINQTTQNNGDSNDKYIFRLQNEGDFGLVNTIEHWGISDMYGEKQRKAIKSSNEKSDNQPTSIPSPFARIALVKTAFNEVAEYGEDALASYQKIVSDSLDVGEIFFTFDKWRNKIEILKWDKNIDLRELKSGHYQLYKTLNTFLESDAEAYNFDRMNSVYLLKHRQTGKMIGATSPCTLFFSTANNLNDVDIQLNNEHKAFDDSIPLHRRSWDFQKYLYSWVAANDEIRNVYGRAATSLFHEFAKYLEVQKLLIGRIEEIDAIIENSLTELHGSFKELRAPDVEVLGKTLYQSKVIGIDSLTVNDILEDKIIRLPYEIQKESFFDGNIQENSKQTYILPIKEKFFDYYTINDLKRFIKINHSGDVVDIKLNTGSTVFKKRYKSSEGKIINLTFDCAIFPNVKFEEDQIANYRFGLVCDFNEIDNYKAEFVKIDSRIDSSNKRHSVRNESHNHNYQLKNYSLEGSNFDYIRIYYNGVNGIIIPTMELKTGNEEFTFTVDFGTTNTHIEYKIDNGEIKSFDISKSQIDEKQVHWLHGGEDYMREVFDEEYIPAYTDEEFKLPMRTALSYGENTNWQNVYPFEKASLNELYEKRLGYPYNKTETDLKWSDNTHNQKQVKAYIESLMYLLRNKVVIGNGNLKKTKIRWFYPVSMERNRFNNLKTVWNEAYKKYFGGDESNIITITESVAPFKYYIKDRNANNLITIDIGGGTTDIVISTTGTVDYITSFRFAANAIFGDGYAQNSRVKNGIVRQFIKEIKDNLKTTFSENDDLFLIFNEMYSNKSSADVASFLFSLKQNKKVRLAGNNLAENANLSAKLLNDTTQKITFIFFYSAIIYHLAKLMKAKDLQMPDKIVFSGNGSRVIPLFTNDKEILKDYTKLIFEKIYDKNYPLNDLEIIMNEDNPKEATCKGGFFVEDPNSFGEILQKIVVLHSNGTDTIIQRNSDRFVRIKKEDVYEAINDNYIQQTVEEAKKFIHFVFELLPFFAIKGYRLNRDSIETAKNVCSKKLDIYTKNGWQLKKQEIAENDSIEETLFFYPLVGMLKELSDAICDSNLSN